MDPITIQIVEVLISPLGLVVGLVVAMIASIIPAVLFLIIMPVFFRRSVRFLPVLLVIAVLHFLTYFLSIALLVLAPSLVEPLLVDQGSTMARVTNLVFTVLYLLIQSVALSLCAWDQDNQQIAAWKWFAGAVISAVLIFVVVFAGVFWMLSA